MTTMTTLITGADGYLGRRIAARLTGDHLLLAVRAGTPTELSAKRDRLRRELGPADYEVVAADLREPGALDLVDPRRVTRIIHAAADTRFSIDRETARRVNLEGTVTVADFADRCPKLELFVALSTLYVAGRRHGEIAESRHPNPGFVNHYEWSKWAAEEHLLDRQPPLPLLIVRLPTVIADDDSGRVVQHNAFHNTMKLYYYGLLSLLTGARTTPLSLATADFAAAAVVHLLAAVRLHQIPGRIVHVSPDPAHCASYGAVVDTAFSVFERDEAFQRRGLLRPLDLDLTGFLELVQVAEGLKGGPIHQAIGSVAPFGEQLYTPKTFRNDQLRSAWPDYHASDPLALIEAVCTDLVATRWNRDPGRSHVPV